MKISLFDVSDLAEPLEKQKYVSKNYCGNRATWDHHAFRFDQTRHKLIIPYYQYSYSFDGESFDNIVSSVF
ncbi:MAG: beta-propeller domain-containing protein [SAR324 cluster bacterium]|nr:beta-propeller domain-containing protein [SAR324 cluster bacterium]